MSDQEAVQTVVRPESLTVDCYRTLFEQAPIACLVVDQDGHLRDFNRQLMQMLVVKQDSSDSQLNFYQYVGREDQSALNAFLAGLFLDKARQYLDIRLIRGDSSVFLARLVGEQIAGTGQLAQITILDLDDDRRNSNAISLLAYYDQLTGLPNRNLLFDRLQWAIRDARRHQERLAVLYVDLDHFKQINDTMGHLAGDQLLQDIALRMTGCLRDSDTLARMGGDEFTVLMQHLIDGQAALAVAARLLDVISQPIEILGLSQTLSASIGICLFPDDGETAEILMKHADIAMYRSKSNGRNALSFFNEEMMIAVDHRADLERRLRLALQERQLVLHYQPIVDAASNRIMALEALLRWDSGADGLLTAEQFLPVAEEIGLSRVYCDWALQNACRQMKTWLDLGLIPAAGPCKISVNLSGAQLDHPGLPDLIGAALESSGLPANRLIVEIREAMLRLEKPQVRHNLIKLRDMQVQLHLDDFNQGFYTLQKISPIPFSYLKIDRMFTAILLQNNHGEALIESLVKLAHLLGILVIAEGVETEQAAVWLKRHGCDSLQGYYFCRPLPAPDLDMLLEICFRNI